MFAELQKMFAKMNKIVTNIVHFLPKIQKNVCRITKNVWCKNFEVMGNWFDDDYLDEKNEYDECVGSSAASQPRHPTPVTNSSSAAKDEEETYWNYLKGKKGKSKGRGKKGGNCSGKKGKSNGQRNDTDAEHKQD